jgi:hypothetical protein
MVEVFKTNIQGKTQASGIVSILKNEFPEYRITIDLDDCDKVLRVECNRGFVAVETLVHLVQKHDIHIELL